MILQKEFIIDTDHPALPGHFPGYPTVPGVVVLDEVLALIQTYRSGLAISSIIQWKFLAPLLPGQVCRITVNITDANKAVVECQVNDKMVSKGKCLLARLEDIR